jgi:FtsP/CotA-like multicopper oxidase with cupredoxin domain
VWEEPTGVAAKEIVVMQGRPARTSTLTGLSSTFKARTLLAGLALALGADIHASTAAGVVAPESPGSGPRHETVVPNDNRHPGGALDRDTLTLALRAGRGSWQPEGREGPALTIEAFGETSSALSVPAPLIRVIEGTRIVISIRNDLDAVLRVHGLCTRDGSACLPLEVPPSETRETRFTSGRAGTYHYWASAIGAPVPFRELAGAFVVDPPGGAVADDRVMVITEWTSLTARQLHEVLAAEDSGDAFVELKPRLTFTINGLSWPATERLTYQLGDKVRWRVINLSSQAHPMHLHGFYFEVESLGNGLRDMPIDAPDRHPVVTQLLQSGATMAMTWTPEREGNWLFHCHIMNHVSPERRLSESVAQTVDHHASHDKSGGMAGMILGVTIVGPASSRSAEPSADLQSPRKLTLVMARNPAGRQPSFGFAQSGDGIPSSPTAAPVSTPGPDLVLLRNQPVEITVVNRLGESTALHWHGMELDSFYDGVHGWSGTNQRLAPIIEPEQSFVVRFTPPRTGTFMYHTHVHDERQLPLGLYGPMIVVDSEETFDPATDHVLMVGRSGIDPAAPNVLISTTPVVINGESAPRFAWKAGVRHRVRLINITPDDIFSVSLQSPQGPVAWTPVSKDGAPLPAGARTLQPARQTIAVGETYDFEVDVAPGRSNLWLEVRSTAGKWQAQGQVMLK